MRRSFIRAAAAAAIGGPWSLLTKQVPAHGVDGKTVRMLVPYPPGQSTDSLGRIVGERLGRLWGRPVVVDNRPGANGSIALQEMARSSPDGRTVLLTSNSPITINPNLYKVLSYQVERDLSPVVLLARASLVLVANRELPIGLAGDFVAYLRSRSGSLNYGSPGVGSTSHLTMEVLKRSLEIDMLHVPYNGSRNALAGLTAGDVHFMVDALSSSLPAIRSGQIRLVALTGAKASSYVPGVPTLAELGIMGLPASAWLGMFLPSGADGALVSRLNLDVSQVLDEPEIWMSLRKLSLEHAARVTAEGFARVIQQETRYWKDVTRRLGIYRSE